MLGKSFFNRFSGIKVIYSTESDLITVEYPDSFGNRKLRNLLEELKKELKHIQVKPYRQITTNIKKMKGGLKK